jgi:hypothetical protein
MTAAARIKHHTFGPRAVDTSAAAGDDAMTAKVMFILDEATALGIRVGTDGRELVMLAPLRVPRETRRWFEAALDQHRGEVIKVIQRENAARTGMMS